MLGLSATLLHGLHYRHPPRPGRPYDPRKSARFSGARNADDVFWTGVYIFFSERAPGATNAVHGRDDDPDVVGKRILRDRDGTLAPATVDDVADPDLAGSWDRYRVDGPGTRVIEAGGRRLISTVIPLSSDARGWLLVITVPEAEFRGFVTVNSQRAGLLSLVVVALALGLAVLLVRQGLRADRADRAIAERSAAVRQQSAAFVRLATEAGQFAEDPLPPATSPASSCRAARSPPSSTRSPAARRSTHPTPSATAAPPPCTAC